MSGLIRDDAARDAMKKYGFDKLVIDETIKKLLEVFALPFKYSLSLSYVLFYVLFTFQIGLWRRWMVFY